MVWEAEAAKTKRHVIVKEPLVNGDQDRIKIERLLIEAAVLRTINDELIQLTGDKNQQLIRDHVVRYVDQLTDPSHPFLVLEFVDGPTLSAICKEKPLPEHMAAQYTLTLLQVIDILHSKGVIHRDISPSNIILNPSRGLVLIDFGTCMLTRRSALGSRSSQSGRVIFKRGFSAPELLEGRSDERSDIFSIGATAFYLVAGRSPADFMPNSRNISIKPVNAVNRQVSTTMSGFIQIAMSPAPERRFRSAAEMIKAMRTQHTVSQSPRPSINVGGVTFELRSPAVDVGRQHVCDGSCKSLGYTNQNQIRITDPQKFIEKHHARIWVDSSGQCYLEDLGSTNRTAVKHTEGTDEFRVLKAFEKEKLEDQDVVALAYGQARGPYVTFTFRVGPGSER